MCNFFIPGRKISTTKTVLILLEDSLLSLARVVKERISIGY
ncbi:hypothetical protein MTATph1_CDS0122 [Moorella phage MTATph1]